MLVMGFEGCTLHDRSPVAKWLADDGLGGVLLFDKDATTGMYGKNLKNQFQIKELIGQLNFYAALNEEAMPLLTAIDYEGGAVDRLSKVVGCMHTLSALELAKLSEVALEEELSQMAATLSHLGFNLNFAPVLDLNLNDQEGIIGALKRSFSDDPEVVVRLAKHFVNVFSHHGIACTYKHFPGHGSAVGDTHEHFVDVTETFQLKELTPYRMLLEEATQPVMVMTAHVVNKNLDNEGLPATLSYPVLTGLLRQEMGFDGVIISDDLQMQAIAEHYSLEDSLCLTINAGSDMVIFANQLGQHSAPEIIDCIEGLVSNKKISKERIDEAFRRIMRLKHLVSL
jgi:beta-N-acetylhexosaminidase